MRRARWHLPQPKPTLRGTRQRSAAAYGHNRLLRRAFLQHLEEAAQYLADTRSTPTPQAGYQRCNSHRMPTREERSNRTPQSGATRHSAQFLHAQARRRVRARQPRAAPRHRLRPSPAGDARRALQSTRAMRQELGTRGRRAARSRAPRLLPRNSPCRDATARVRAARRRSCAGGKWANNTCSARGSECGRTTHAEAAGRGDLSPGRPAQLREGSAAVRLSPAMSIARPSPT